MNVGLIIAGGVGARAKTTIPKQFVVVRNKPVIVYTMEAFQRNSVIDAIAVVCLHGWEEILWKYAETYGINKLKWVTVGGETGMQSLHNGMELLRQHCDPQDIIVIHDAVRPLLGDDIINANIAGVKKHGNAITCIPCTEALLQSEDGELSERVVDRSKVYRTQTPQSLYLSKFIWCHEQAAIRGITNTVATCTLLVELGEPVYFVDGNVINFKITTNEDFSLMEAYLDCMKYRD